MRQRGRVLELVPPRAMERDDISQSRSTPLLDGRVEFRGGRVRGNPRRRGGGRLMAVARQPAQEG